MEESAPYRLDARSNSRLRPSFSPKANAPADPARAPNRLELTAKPDWKDDSSYLHSTNHALIALSHTSMRQMGSPFSINQDGGMQVLACSQAGAQCHA